MLDWAGRKEGTAVAMITPCPAILRKGGVERGWPDIPAYSEQCGKLRDSVIALLHDRPDITTVILSARWSVLPRVLYRGAPESQSEESGRVLLREGMTELLDAIGTAKKVVLFLDVPEVPLADPASCAATMGRLLRRPCTIDIDALVWRHYSGVQRHGHDVLLEAAAGRPNVTVVDSGASLCSSDRCRTWLNGEFLYRDSDHIRRNLTGLTTSALAELLHLDVALRASDGASASRR
jgi:hypothetical protein